MENVEVTDVVDDDVTTSVAEAIAENTDCFEFDPISGLIGVGIGILAHLAYKYVPKGWRWLKNKINKDDEDYEDEDDDYEDDDDEDDEDDEDDVSDDAKDEVDTNSNNETPKPNRETRRKTKKTDKNKRK